MLEERRQPLFALAAYARATELIARRKKRGGLAELRRPARFLQAEAALWLRRAWCSRATQDDAGCWGALHAALRTRRWDLETRKTAARWCLEDIAEGKPALGKPLDGLPRRVADRVVLVRVRRRDVVRERAQPRERGVEVALAPADADRVR